MKVVASGDVAVSPRTVSVVVPTYCSEEFIDGFVERVVAVFADLEEDLDLILVNDASPDGTWSRLCALKERYPTQIQIICLLKNSGQHNAILCGLHYANGDVTVTMDDDLQHPPEEIPKLIKALDEGVDLVIAASEEKQHAKYRNLAGEMIDGIIRHVYKLPKTLQLTSFRAVRGSVVSVARRSANPYPYITCILLDQAARVSNVWVRHDERPFGTTSYSLTRSLRLAANLLFSYSSVPLYLTLASSGLAILLSFVMLGWVFFQLVSAEIAVPGWASVMLVMTLFSALILASLLVLGIYVARIHHQLSGRRVPYTVEHEHVRARRE